MTTLSNNCAPTSPTELAAMLYIVELLIAEMPELAQIKHPRGKPRGCFIYYNYIVRIGELASKKESFQ